MRTLVASFFMAEDGVVQGPGPEDDFELAGWTMPYWMMTSRRLFRLEWRRPTRCCLDA